MRRREEHRYRANDHTKRSDRYAAGGSWQRVESLFGRAVVLLLCGVVVVVAAVAVTRRIARRARTR